MKNLLFLILLGLPLFTQARTICPKVAAGGATSAEATVECQQKIEVSDLTNIVDTSHDLESCIQALLDHFDLPEVPLGSKGSLMQVACSTAGEGPSTVKYSEKLSLERR